GFAGVLKTGLGYTYWSKYDRDSRDFQILITRKELKTRPAMPLTSILLQNYPNPFNPETWIPYYLSESSSVTIRVYGASGQLVRNLNLGNRHAGYYDTKENAAYWDGLNEYGEQVSSGLYFYTIQAGYYTATKKMTVVR
ncbi:FlgD immunoglobulin-like domain containing protein, partial [Candidatus Poribacteria bacterium]